MGHVFKTYHPAVAFAYLACAIACTMAVMHPLYAALSLAGALACSCVTRGGRATVLSLRWVVPLCALVTLANSLLVASGSTELLHIGGFVLYAEALLYGACAGGMFAAVFLWFASYAACLDSEASMMLFARVLPTVSFMVSHVLRLVPQFIARGKTVAAVQDAARAAAPQSKREAAHARMRVVNVLAGWGMEDGLERSSAMRARGYGCGAKRTSYQRFRFGAADACMAGIILVLAACSAVGAWYVMDTFEFYPVVSGEVLTWACVPYAALMALPSVLQAKEWLLWKSYE